MRSFVVSCILLTVVTVFLVVNMITIHQYSKELYALCEELPDSAEACKADSELQSRVEKLNEAWQKYRFYINFSVGYAYTEKIEDSIHALKCWEQTESFADFIMNRTLCLDAIERLREAEGVSVGSFF